jgi:hypothetical protein
MPYPSARASRNKILRVCLCRDHEERRGKGRTLLLQEGGMLIHSTKHTTVL